MRRITALLATLALVLCMAPAVALAAPSATGTWIVTLRGDADPHASARSLLRAHGGELRHVYEHALRGFSFRGSSAAADAITRNPTVSRVEADAEVWLETTQAPATWGLDRIDQPTRPIDNSYTYDTAGAGVTAYVIDSGINFTHAEFGGRAVAGADFIGDGQNGKDCNGHGTHVSGTIGGTTYGVAKSVTLVSVRVFACTGGSTWSTIIAGIDWAAGNHVAGTPAVANMSLGGGASASVDAATNGLIADGVATAVAAGNGDWLGRQANACNYSPARVPAAMTISATNSSDQKASWANYGDCVDWFAPGVSITSAWYGSNTATKTISGTSMATPHSAGVAALYLSANPGASPATVRDAIYARTTKGIVSSSSTANNHLLFSRVTDSDSEPPANRPPTAGAVSITVDAGDTVAWSAIAADPDGDALTCAIDAGPTKGSATLTSCAPGAGSYTADATVSGADSFTYTVSDGRGGTTTATVTVSIAAAPDPPSDALSLTVSGYKVKGLKRADLAWAGASSTDVDLYRDGILIANTPNDGAYTDSIGTRGGGSYTYQVCEAGTGGTCSPEVTVSY